MPHFADTSKYTPEEFEIWDMLIEHQGETFRTAKGLEFTYTIVGNQLAIDRKKNPINRGAVNSALKTANELKVVTGPKKLNVFGASYLYPIFLDLGICFKE